MKDEKLPVLDDPRLQARTWASIRKCPLKGLAHVPELVQATISQEFATRGAATEGGLSRHFPYAGS